MCKKTSCADCPVRASLEVVLETRKSWISVNCRWTFDSTTLPYQMEWNNLVVCILLSSESWIPLLLLLLGLGVNGGAVNCQSPLCPLADHWMDPTVNLPLICLFRALLCSSMGLGTSRWIRVYSSVRRSGFLSSGEGGPLSVGLRDKSSASIHSPPQCTDSAKLTVHGKKQEHSELTRTLAREHFSQLDWLLVQGRCQVSSSRFLLNQL